ncbi:hypothetical protein [Vreelandella gomseomensis]|uniref:ApeA N-terminal domain-containing protein n=1 Tax=Vreelandella gomseomensis TaxID=370766 RepID=A0ABU1G7P1_9GAMM|nr:hypothetical protein [Halomonas gomseomensis]MDR5873297.1 hypothetical protein [Halomonas gomseomensis]
MPLEFIKENLEKVDCEISIEGNKIYYHYDGNKEEILIDDDWKKEIRSYKRSNQFEFDLEERRLVGPRIIESMVAPLGADIFYRPDYTFTAGAGREVRLTESSKRFQLSFFASAEYERFFESVIQRKISRFIKRERKLSFGDLLWRQRTISYHVPRKQEKYQIMREGLPKMEACLFKLAAENNECWEFRRRIKKPVIAWTDEFDEDNLKIPLAKYDSNLVKYFKVAISSQFPSQSFLAFYHVLEYNFLLVSDEVLHGRLKSHVNSTRFQGQDDEIEKIISIVKKHGSSSDETEMLMRVLRKYVDEEELIEFISKSEDGAEEKIYSKTREVFGERFHIQLKSDHVISNTAKLIKHIRNALVHSSDRYSRDDCHIPLTESEDIVREYIPLIRFLSERVICAKTS